MTGISTFNLAIDSQYVIRYPSCFCISFSPLARVGMLRLDSLEIYLVSVTKESHASAGF